MTVLLLDVGRDRYELYSEPPDDEIVAPAPDAGRVRRWTYQALIQWRDLVDVARRGEASGWWATQRDRIVCRLAETIAEQRTLWALVSAEAAVLLFPSSMAENAARRQLDTLLVRARRHHGWWLLVDGVVFIASAILAPIPGPNVVASYLAFRLIGHAQSWRGAGGGMRRVTWTLQPDQMLTELAALAGLSREARRSRVDAIAAQFNLRRLAAFFERVAL